MHWTATPGAPSSKHLGGSKVDSAFLFSENDQMSTRIPSGFVVKNKLSPCSGYKA